MVFFFLHVEEFFFCHAFFFSGPRLRVSPKYTPRIPYATDKKSNAKEKNPQEYFAGRVPCPSFNFLPCSCQLPFTMTSKESESFGSTAERLVYKSIDIALYSNLYFWLGMIVSLQINGIFPAFDEEEYAKKKTMSIIFELAINLTLIVWAAWMITSIIEELPLPFGSVIGHLSERAGGIVKGMALMTFQSKFHDKVVYLSQERLGYRHFRPLGFLKF